MKKILSFLFICLLAFFVVGCSFNLFKSYSISIDDANSNVTLEVGDTKKIAVTSEGGTLEWISSDQSIVTVTDGTLTALKAGVTTVIVQIKENPDTNATINVTVKEKVVAVTEISLLGKKTEVEVGETFDLIASVLPLNATNKEVTWVSSNATVATVVNGKVTALKAGTAEISATAGDKTDKFTLTVKEKPVEIVKKDLVDVLNNGKNNDAIMVEGIVYGVISNGFYIADSAAGKAFVVMGDNWTANCQVGDKVQVTGKFGNSSFPQIKNVTEVKVLSSNETSPINPTTGSIFDILSLNKATKTGVYGNMYTVTATIYKNAANIFILKDDDNYECNINSKSNIDVLSEFVNKRVAITVIVHNYTETWSVSFVGGASDIEIQALSFDDLKEKALEHINEVVPKSIYGRLELPDHHPDLAYVTYEWSVQSNDFLSISNNKVTVNIDEQDHEITLNVKICDGEVDETVAYKIVSKAIVEKNVSDLLSGEYAINYSMVKVRAIVVGKSRNQSETIRSLIVKDVTTADIITIDFNPENPSEPDVISHSSDIFKNIKFGDEVVITGQLRNGEDDRTCVTKVTKVEVTKHDVEYHHDFENAIVLNDQESYDDFGINVKKYENKLVKFENPYLSFSTNSTPSATNWLDFSYAASTTARSFGANGKSRYFAFLLACADENLGGTAWRDAFDIPFANQDAKQFDLTIYAYAIYVSDSYLAFVIPDTSCFIASPQMQVELELGKDIPASIEDGTITLPKTHDLVTGEITWASDNVAINVSTGAVGEVTVSTTVTLTATYTIGNDTFTSSFRVEVLAANPMSVSEVLALTEDRKVKVSGIIVGYVSDGNTQAQRMGVLLMDPTTKDLVMVDGLSTLGGSYGAYKDSDGVVLKVGDLVTIKASYYVDSAQIGTSGPAQTGRHHIEITSNDKVTRVAENQEVVYGEPALVIDSNEDMTTLANNIQDYYGKLIKIVGTKDAPIYLGGSSTTLPFNIKVFMNNATDNNGTKYGAQTFTLKTEVNAPNGGSEDWYKSLFGFEGAFVGPSTSNPAIVWVGTLYVVVGYRTSSYYQMSIVNYANCQGDQLLTPEMIGKHLLLGLPAKVKSGAWKVNLPAEYKQVEGTITWVSGNQLIDLTNNKVGYVDEDTEVTITGTYKVENVDYTTLYKVTIEKSATKAEVEAALQEGIVSELYAGIIPFNLVTSTTGASNVSWTSSNTDVINLETGIVNNVNADTVVKLTATYTFREHTETLEVNITVKKVDITEEELAAIKSAILTAVNATDGKIIVDASEAGQLTLPTTAAEKDLTWISSNSSVLSVEGNYGKLYTQKVVKLIALFRGGIQEVEVTLTPAESVTVSEEYGKNEDVAALRCVLLAFTGKSSLTQDGAVRYFYVSDGKNYFTIDGTSSNTSFNGNICDSDSQLVITIGEDEIYLEVGDELVFEDVTVADKKLVLKDTTVVSVIGKVDVNAEGWFAPEVIKATITNDEELNALASGISTNGLYKIVATEENPIYFNGYNSATDLTKNFLAFYYLTDEEKAMTDRNACATMVGSMPYFIGGSYYPTIYNLGIDWVIDNFYPEGTTEITEGILYDATNCPQETFKFTGEFYVMAQYRYTSGSKACYVLLQILLPGMNLTKDNTPS